MPDFPRARDRPLEEHVDKLTRHMIEMDNRLKKLEAIKSQAQYRSHKTRDPHV